MPWLNTAPIKTQISTLVGYSTSVTGFNESLTFAEEIIEAFTGLTFGEVIADTVRIRLDAKSYTLDLPLDVQSVVSVAGLPSGTTFELSKHQLFSRSPNLTPWAPGLWEVQVQRGFQDIPETIIKAATYLVGFYLSLSDPDRSRFAAFSAGGVATATLISKEIPVPEAQALLYRFVRRSGGALC